LKKKILRLEKLRNNFLPAILKKFFAALFLFCLFAKLLKVKKNQRTKMMENFHQLLLNLCLEDAWIELTTFSICLLIVNC